MRSDSGDGRCNSVGVDNQEQCKLPPYCFSDDVPGIGRVVREEDVCVLADLHQVRGFGGLQGGQRPGYGELADSDRFAWRPVIVSGLDDSNIGGFPGNAASRCEYATQSASKRALAVSPITNNEEDATTH